MSRNNGCGHGFNANLKNTQEEDSMVIWDLDDKHLFPPVAVTAYVKNLLHMSGSAIRVDSLVSTQVNHYVLSGVDAECRRVELMAPIACRSRVGETYIPCVFQRSVLRSEYRWGLDGLSTKGCMKIGEQPFGLEFKLVTNRHAFLRFARSGKPRGCRTAENYGSRVRDYIEKEFAKDYISDQFRFVDVYTKSDAVVPYLPMVLNRPEPEEFPYVRQKPISAIQRLVGV
jgi:hypothetical protein